MPKTEADATLTRLDADKKSCITTEGKACTSFGKTIKGFTFSNYCTYAYSQGSVVLPRPTLLRP